MKKIWTFLILCLVVTSSSYSQRSSQTLSDSVIVPVVPLRNALIVLEQRNFCYENLTIARDSIYNLNQIITNKDTLIWLSDEIITTKDSVIKKYEDIIVNKDREITIYKDLYIREKYEKWGGIIGVLVLVGIIFF